MVQFTASLYFSQVEVVVLAGLFVAVLILDRLLADVKVCYLLRARRVLGGFVLSHAQESGKSEGDATILVDDADGRAMNGGNGQVGGPHLPHLDCVEPVIGGQRRVVCVVALRSRQLMSL